MTVQEAVFLDSRVHPDRRGSESSTLLVAALPTFLRVVAQQPDLASTTAAIAEQLVAKLGALRSAVYLVDGAATRTLRLAASRNVAHDADVDFLDIDVSSLPAARAARTRALLIAGNANPPVTRTRGGGLLASCKPAVAFALPLLVGDRLLGAVSAELTTRLEPRDLEELESLGAVLAAFVDRARLAEHRPARDEQPRPEHLDTLRTLAAGVGHEINNPLTVVLPNLEFAIEELRAIAGSAPSGRFLELIGVLDDARDGAERIRRIVAGLRALASEEVNTIPTEVAGAVDVSIRMAAPEIRQRATVAAQIAQATTVFADSSRLTQILVNLLVNAGQAFATDDVDKNRITVTSARERDGRVSIAVSDNGPGIPAEVQRRIFHPFFTTKPVGVGAGLGLTISQSFVRALGGEILVESVVGEGTTFRVLLPGGARPLGA